MNQYYNKPRPSTALPVLIAGFYVLGLFFCFLWMASGSTDWHAAFAWVGLLTFTVGCWYWTLWNVSYTIRDEVLTLRMGIFWKRIRADEIISVKRVSTPSIFWGSYWLNNGRNVLLIDRDPQPVYISPDDPVELVVNLGLNESKIIRG